MLLDGHRLACSGHTLKFSHASHTEFKHQAGSPGAELVAPAPVQAYELSMSSKGTLLTFLFNFYNLLLRGFISGKRREASCSLPVNLFTDG